MKYAQHPKRDCPAGRAGFDIDVLVINSNPLPRSRIGLPMCFHHQCKTKHSGGRCSSELGKRGQPDTVTRVTTNVSSRFGVVRVISDARVIRGYSCVDVWECASSLDQRPINMIMNTGHSPRYIAMAAPDLIECVPTIFLFIRN